MPPIFALAALLSAPPTADGSPPPGQVSSSDVVVTARRLSDTAAALAACLKRGCPPDQDIEASLDQAGNQFVAGDYDGARATIAASVSRNRRFAKAYPVPVSDLMRAGARVAVHLGLAREYRQLTLDTLGALKAGLPADDARVFAQRLEMAQMFVHIGLGDQAEAQCRSVAHDAHAAGRTQAEGAARLQLAMLHLRGMADPRLVPAGAPGLRELDALAAEGDPGFAPFALAARVLRAQWRAAHGDGVPLSAMTAELRRRLGGAPAPILLSSEPIRLAGRSAPLPDEVDGAPVSSSITRAGVAGFDREWMDVSYRIMPDGSVRDVAVLRTSRRDVAEWNPPVLRSIASRRYVPLGAQTGAGLLRVERYTYTSFLDPTVTGSRLPQRDGAPRVEMLDLSIDDGAAAARPAPAG